MCPPENPSLRHRMATAQQGSAVPTRSMQGPGTYSGVSVEVGGSQEVSTYPAQVQGSSHLPAPQAVQTLYNWNARQHPQTILSHSV